MPDLLLELFSEEIPARMQAKAADDLRRLVTDGLVEAGLTYAGAGAFSTPRRLTLALEGLAERSPDTREERKGPRVDAPEKAVEGFCRSAGVARDSLEVRADKKGEVYFAVIDRPGRPAAEIVAEVVAQVIRAFPWPKSMRWGEGSLRWVRPLHSILCILTTEAGAEVVPVEVEGIAAGDTTEGHRFMAPGRFAVSSFEDYELQLAKRFVLLNRDTRAEKIWHDAEQAAFAQGLELVEDKGLLAEVAGLVEWPVVLMGDIGDDFLGLPPEVLQTSMREHQKFFSVKNPATGRIEKWVTVANRETDDHGSAIVEGNARVLAARLSDARFFWENDLRTVRAKGLEGMAARLADVTFHAKLGSQAERVERIAALAREIAPLLGAAPDLAAEAARVCKADLASEMVYEFPELQGVMGRYYAEAAGHDDGVPQACQEHYAPLGPSDAVPTAPVSVAVALADKIDMLCGFWAIDEKPTGSGDPYALRRAALGVVRVVLDNGIRFSLKGQLSSGLRRIAAEPWKDIRSEIDYLLEHSEAGEERISAIAADLLSGPTGFIFAFDGLSTKFVAGLSEMRKNVGNVQYSFDTYNAVFERAKLIEGFSADCSEYLSHGGLVEAAIDKTASDLLAFFADRLKVHLRADGIRHDVIDACFQLGNQDDLVLLVSRVRALQSFLETEDGANLLAGYKRAANILAIEEKKDGVEYSLDPQPKLAQPGAEADLFAALDAADAAIGPALRDEDFGRAMAAMAELRAPIDAFFDKVMVNDDNAMIRRNRLCLLHRIRSVMNRVALFSSIEGG